ncbi:MAG TPA: NapC/NirT family cytochrome c [Candidatus Omnitrophota bacterium]|nr:NapC/NirT family cytochrome c [Candidatus Omnitrophota bacterium]
MQEENKDRSEKPAEGKKFSDFFYNIVTYVGVLIALFVFILECFLFGIDFLTEGYNVYLGIFTYALLPPFLIFGLLLIPVGALWKRHRVLKGFAPRKPKTLFLDPSVATHRNAIFVFIIGTGILIVMTAVGSYKAFHYTESVHFCGITCHQVMRPQYTTYLQSPHARVKCVECHIGEGADWYVRSKLSGMRQVYHTLKGDFSKPIETPIKNLRPAKETCEKCHWPNKFYNSFEIRRTYYLTEENEPPQWYLRMLVQVGGSEKEDLGIHAHMDVNNDIYYYAEDKKRQKITWIKSVDKQGKETIYTSPDYKLETKELPAELIREMDCMDCHNRPTHQVNAPFRIMNKAMYEGAIDATIPSIKKKVLEVLTKDYTSTPEAVTSIKNELLNYYQKKHSEYYLAHQGSIEKAIGHIVYLYEHNFFPEMKVRWDIYEENIGHMTSNGCFRCHDNEHTAEDGKTISRDCNICHMIIEQGPPGMTEKSTDGLPFRHPTNIDDAWKDMSCSDCHTGGAD